MALHDPKITIPVGSTIKLLVGDGPEMLVERSSPSWVKVVWLVDGLARREQYPTSCVVVIRRGDSDGAA